ncbi:hypothetical protein NGI46_08060 [Peribacillus butanolivorans]|uniref:hypothetical protein n=1 Tax=Peribacillus butanolivorans TaxID=421767 RepID=UPI00207C8A48|nr:hypothetical protein [Peribacillus butanolivorans]MCO0597421.1 hypothetical protein [Peribacillus butanolivorans]
MDYQILSMMNDVQRKKYIAACAVEGFTEMLTLGLISTEFHAERCLQALKEAE